MYQFTNKLDLVKIELKTLYRHHTSHIPSKIAQAKVDYNASQFLMDQNPTATDLHTNERALAKHYIQLCKDEESYYTQKFKIQWLQFGDRNTKFFHKSLLHHQVRNIIHSLIDEIGNLINDQLAMGKLTT
jgi:hypothetical protein